ncbi:alpha-D-ribose 1-methylphosphonate 5-triphosphate synthase subunit PhnG [Ralstonia sp. 25mfcol4.1]|uniref:phosphonate C-P lyase system protein PhnG n=1 Tax=Ralstonia sp. 25mfcol4.1 TaxID=1761899 RepID=UPI000891BE89|nr:phosphonate C-P lyase system protein PhnG [Ralstonia sp. 25mfcol4.1]SDO78108.1 alpha-D-ribose 1-methylphosphonate 5-triphosphate synthase subunit PhnG [Ralstonia sp. 25mfcol4.1]
MQSETANQANAARAAWLRVLALAQPDALDAAYIRLREQATLPGYRLLRKPESGMAMVRARAGGTGAQFNLGEMSVTRCAVVLDESHDVAATAGVSYVQGRGQRHAEQAAVLDALLQQPAWHQRVQDVVVAPLAQALTERAARQAAIAAQTRVEFFTMARGED